MGLRRCLPLSHPTRRPASCARRYCCAGFLIFFGIIAKIAAIIASIPDCVLGGMTTFLFVNIAVSGLKIVGNAITNRRNRSLQPPSLLRMPASRSSALLP